MDLILNLNIDILEKTAHISLLQATKLFFWTYSNDKPFHLIKRN